MMIRYPGSKEKIVRKIVARFPDSLYCSLFQPEDIEYREPFFGAGAIGFDILDRLPPSAPVWLNDKDYGMVCLWNSVKSDPGLLIEKINDFDPSVDAFYELKEKDAEPVKESADPVEVGFRKFALHRISFSGLGAMAGGPIGGKKQSSSYNVDCRWNPIQHRADVEYIHELFARFKNLRITCRDFSEVIDRAPESAFIYADPPYYEKGPALYKHSLSDDDHRRLATSLQHCRANWVLSYDDHPFVRGLYPWAEISSIAFKYTMAIEKDKRRKNQEIIITPRVQSATEAA